MAAIIGASSLLVGTTTWLLSRASDGGDMHTAAITVTQTVAVTVTRPAASPPNHATTPSSAPEPGAVGPVQWVVRTPAGMVCLFDATIVTCAGTFDSGAKAYQWRNGAADADPVHTNVDIPADGASLSYGSRRSAGPWAVTMAESGITFENTTSGAVAEFSRAGVEIG